MAVDEATTADAAPDSLNDAPPVTEEKELPVTVALMMRPLVGPELVDGCQECVFPHDTDPSVSLVSEHKFTYDHVYHGAGPTEKALYDQCVEPLVNGLLAGYNATVLAYGQTGSGKTHTMGTAYEPGGATCGVIPRVMQTLFANIAALPEGGVVNLRVSFIEIHKEDIRDLLQPKSVVSLRDAPGGSGVVLVGVKELQVSTVEEMAQALANGSQTRATASTGMNHRSSRSHAIFTIHVERKGADPADVTRAKMHLVDLAGSERAKRTKAEGQRLKEGIQINKGLLALGNVISALGDDKRRHAGGHVPYRDSKLTRLLQDSLGGNSRTVMVACISPADANLDETLNTLKYANRARNIMNKPTVTFDENASQQVAKLRRMLAAARAEVAHLKLNGAAPFSGGALSGTGGSDDLGKLDAMEARAMIAEAEASRLRADLKAAEEAAAASAAAELAAGVERDRLALKLQDAGLSAEDDEGGSNVIRSYLSTIQVLRNEQSRLKQQLAAFHEGREDPWGEDPAASYDLDGELFEEDEPEGMEDEEEPALELEEDMEGDEIQAELATVERTLQAKEARMRAMSSQAAKLQAEVDAAIVRGGGAPTPGSPEQQDVEELREKYGRLLASLESEKSELVEERDKLLAALASAAKQGEDVRREVEAKNRGRLQQLEQRLEEVQKLAAKHKEAARLREKSDLAAKTLQADIHRLRAARVELVRRMERAAKEGVTKQREAERALQAARKEGRRHAIAAQKAQQAVDRQAAVLRRKTEEAASAREQLRALQVAAKANQRKKTVAAPAAPAAVATVPTPTADAVAKPEETVAAPDPANAAGPGTGLSLAARKAWLEAEISSAVERAELRASLEESLAHRAALGRRFPHLASPGKAAFSERSPAPDVTPSPGAAGDDETVEQEMHKVTEQIAMLQERLYQSEEREEMRGGPRRWSRVRSLGEARSLLTILFNFAASARRKANGGETGKSISSSAPRRAGALPHTPGGSVVAQADAVLNALKNKTAARAKKKFVRPAWVSVGPSTLVPSDTEEEEKKSAEEQAGKKKKKKSSVEYLSDDQKDESEEEQEHGEDEEWNPNCQTPAVMGGRARRVAPAKEAAKAACTLCTQMFQKRVEGHQKSHRRCPFFSLYCIEKEMKSLEQAEGAGAEEALELKRSEHTLESSRLRAAIAEGNILPPGEGELFNPSSEGPGSASSDGMAGASDIGGKSDSRSESQATPESSKGEIPLSELITTCRNARRRAEGLLHASGGGATATKREPFGDVSNAAPGSASALDVRKRMSFGGSRSSFGEASDPFAPPMVTMGRGSFGDVGVDNEFVEPSEEVFGTINPDDL